ncbi:MAG: hypothetical protein AB7N76_04945 [Planctomycetota bacterium]
MDPLVSLSVMLAVLFVAALVLRPRRSARRTPRLPPLPPPAAQGGARLWTSVIGQHQGVPPTPLILYGHLAAPAADPRALAGFIAQHSTLNVVEVPDAAVLDAWLAEHQPLALLAMSRPGLQGEAGEAIRRVRARAERAPVLYHAWDYDVQRAAARALEYGADGLVLPGIEANELFAVVLGVLDRATRGVARPASVEEHVALLRQLAPTSPFWKLGGQAPPSPEY